MLINNFTIGADPEFAAIQPADSKVINVDSLDEWGAHSPKIHDDHMGDCLEFTPDPSKSAFILTKNINTILREDKFIQRLDKKVKLVGGAVVQGSNRLITLGGHIHFSDKTALNDPKCRALDRVTKFLEALDI